MSEHADHRLQDVYIPIDTRERIKECITEALNSVNNSKGEEVGLHTVVRGLYTAVIAC
jgi:hypothetical protein